MFLPDLTALINRYSKENGSNTPDWILAEYLQECLKVFDAAMQARERWYGRSAIAVAVLGEPREAGPLPPDMTEREHATEHAGC